MASPSLLPYDYEEIVELNYEFVNRDGIRYHLYFTPMDVLYPDMVNTYSFNIEREGTAPHSIDRRIAATVIDILRRFFEKVENAMIMVCDNPNRQQLLRSFNELMSRDIYEIVV